MFLRVAIVLLIFPLGLKAQVDGALRDSVLGFFQKIRFSNDVEKMAASAKLELLFSAYYSKDENFEMLFDSVPYLGQLGSDDNVIKMVCWNLALDNGEFQYHCVMRHRSGKEPAVLTVFQDTDEDWRKLTRRAVRPTDWYGALYYRILTDRYKGKTYYTLIGWDGRNGITNRKIIDVLSIQGNTISLGAGIFTEDKRTVYRLIYEYANDATMALNYDEKEKMIIMDHLAPEDSRFTGQYQFYGPDFSYDALVFEKGKWVFKRDVFAKNRGLNNLPKDARPGDFKD